MVPKASKKATAPPGTAEAPPRTFWGRLLRWASLIGVVSALVTFAYTRIAAHRNRDFEYHVNDLIDKKLLEPSKKLDSVANDMATVKGQLQVLQPLIQELILRKISDSLKLSSKDYLAALPQLKELLATATQLRVSIDPAVVEKGAKKAIDVSRENPTAWPVASDFLAFRSVLTASAAPPTPPNLKPPQLITNWRIAPEVEGNGAIVTIGFVNQVVSPISATRFEKFGENLDQGQPGGPPLAFINGNGAARLLVDDFWIKNVVIQNSVIVYKGGRIKLENVYFVNCRFELTPIEEGRKLADALVSAPVNFANQPS